LLQKASDEKDSKMDIEDGEMDEGRYVWLANFVDSVIQYCNSDFL